MKKTLLLPVLIVLICSCSPKLVYVGGHYGRSETVDVFVDEANIKKDYEIIGTGTPDLSYTLAGKNYDEIIVEKAVEKAKKHGADAVLFKNYFIKPIAPVHQQQSQTIYTDTSIYRKSSQTVQLPPQSTGRQILFLKYKK
jgi:nucleotide-binding universal stress UspA family protein